MFKPVKPLLLEPSASEKRLMEKGIDRGVGGLIGGRMSACEVQPEFETVLTPIGDKFLLEDV